VFGTYAATETAALLGTHGLLYAGFAHRRNAGQLHSPSIVRLVGRGLIRTYQARSQNGIKIVAAALDDAHPAALEIAALAAALGRAFVLPKPTERTPQVLPPITPLSAQSDVTGSSADILGPKLRPRVLLSIAALGEKRFISVLTASQTIPKGLVEVIDILGASGIVRARRRPGRTSISLDEQWNCANELRRLLARLLELNPE
jgi:hypothetical protein